jgi:hypothetical protein
LNAIEIEVGPAGYLAGYASIPARFSTDTIFSVSADGPPFELTGQPLDTPLHKNYDELESPHEWPKLFDVSQLKVETQNVNHAACRFYEAMVIAPYSTN